MTLKQITALPPARARQEFQRLTKAAVRDVRRRNAAVLNINDRAIRHGELPANCRMKGTLHKREVVNALRMDLIDHRGGPGALGYIAPPRASDAAAA